VLLWHLETSHDSPSTGLHAAGHRSDSCFQELRAKTNEVTTQQADTLYMYLLTLRVEAGAVFLLLRGSGL